jgi:hypothetical protein
LPDASTTVYFDVAFISAPGLEVDVDFFNAGSEVPAALRALLIQKVAARTASLG